MWDYFCDIEKVYFSGTAVEQRHQIINIVGLQKD